jgi:hypothetical protein
MLSVCIISRPQCAVSGTFTSPYCLTDAIYTYSRPFHMPSPPEVGNKPLLHTAWGRTVYPPYAMTHWQAACAYRYSGAKRRLSAWLPTDASGKEDSTLCSPNTKCFCALTHQTCTSTAVLINRSDVTTGRRVLPGRKPKFNAPMNV